EPDGAGCARNELVVLAGAGVELGGADLDQRGGRGPEPRLDLHLARGDDVLGERLPVDLDRVGALFLHGDVPLAVVAGLDRLLLTGSVRHGYLDGGRGALP